MPALMPLPRPTQRLALGVALSGAIHVAIMLAVRPAADRYVPPSPLTVEIRRESASTELGEIAASSPSERLAEPVSAPSPDQAIPREAPPVVSGVRETPSKIDVPLDRYFTLPEVDVRPEQINEVDLVYPSRAYVMRTKGKVVLRIFINEHGTVDDVSVLEAAPPGVFEEAALTAIFALKFRPAMKRGHPVRIQSTIEVAFDPYERINVP